MLVRLSALDEAQIVSQHQEGIYNQAGGQGIHRKCHNLLPDVSDGPPFGYGTETIWGSFV